MASTSTFSSALSHGSFSILFISFHFLLPLYLVSIEILFLFIDAAIINLPLMDASTWSQPNELGKY